MSTAWPRTLADDPEEMRRFAVHPEAFDPSLTTTPVSAPCCGRRTVADTVVSLHGLETEISAGNHQPKRNHDWACDGCLHLLVLDPANDWTRAKLARALGAPHNVIRHERALELVHQAERAAGDKSFDRKREYEKAHASLPANVRALPGTERPDV